MSTQPTITEIDDEIDRLLRMRKQILTYELTTSRQTGKMLRDVIRKAASITQPDASRQYIARYVLPWKLFMKAEHFPATMDMLPESAPDNWHLFIHTLSAALQQDREALDECIHTLSLA